MTVKYHFSINGPNRELLGVQAEGVGDHIYSEFMAAVQDVGLDGVFGQLSGGVTGAAIAAATAITQPPPATYAPVQAQPQMPAAAGMTCAHGARVRRTGNSQKGPWVGHFCPTPKGSPDQCKAIFE